MFVAELLFAFVIALILVSVISFGFGRPGPWGGFLWFFLLVFLGAWAIGVWVPAGPLFWGVAWVPIFFGAILLALLIAAIPPSEPAPPRTLEAGEPVEPASSAGAAVGVFFWILLLLLVIAVAWGYWWV